MRWIFRLVSALVVVALFAVGAVAMLPAERIAGLVADQFKAATGRDLTIQGDIRPSVWPELGIKTGEITVSNAEWSNAGPMIQAQGLSIGVDIQALWGGAIRVTEVEAIAPNIVLEINSNGTGNWELPTTASDAVVNGGGANGPAAAPNFALDHASLSNGQITFIDHASGALTRVSDISGAVTLPDLAGPATVDFTAMMNRQKVELDGRIASFANFLAQGVVGTSANIQIGGSRIE